MEIFNYQIIANLLAGKGLAEKKLEEVERFLTENNLSYTILKITQPSPISLIPANGETFIDKGVICIGGDGTVSETIGFMAKREIDLPIFIIPTGTANFLADNVGVAKGKSFSRILKGKIKEFDLGIYEDNKRTDYFLMGIGFGFEQKFLEMAKQRYKKYLGKFSYYFAALAELFKLKAIPYSLILDGKKFQINSVMLTVLNLKPKISRFFPLFAEKEIKPNDGLLDVIFIDHHNYLTSALGVLSFHLLGRLDFGLVKKFKAKDIELDSPVATNSQFDGEIKGKLPFKISVRPRKIKFLI